MFSRRFNSLSIRPTNANSAIASRKRRRGAAHAGLVEVSARYRHRSREALDAALRDRSSTNDRAV